MLILAAGFDPGDATDQARLRLARRTLGHQKLLLFVPADRIDAVAPLVVRDGALGAPIAPVAVPRDDVLGCIETMSDAFSGAQAAGDTVRASVSGGTIPMTAAALLACMATATEAWFFDGGRGERLMVLQKHVVTERFTALEHAVLAALDAPREIEALPALCGAPVESIRAALLRLRRDDLVVVRDGRRVEATRAGDSYRHRPPGGPGG